MNLAVGHPVWVMYGDDPWPGVIQSVDIPFGSYTVNFGTVHAQSWMKVSRQDIRTFSDNAMFEGHLRQLDSMGSDAAPFAVALNNLVRVSPDVDCNLTRFVRMRLH